MYFLSNVFLHRVWYYVHRNILSKVKSEDLKIMVNDCYHANHLVTWQAVLDGYGWLLEDQTSRLPKVNKFLEKVPEYQVELENIKRFNEKSCFQNNNQSLLFQQKIDTIHEQVIRGELKSVKRMLDKRGWVQVHHNFYKCRAPVNSEVTSRLH